MSLVLCCRQASAAPMGKLLHHDREDLDGGDVIVRGSGLIGGGAAGPEDIFGRAQSW